MRFTQCPVCGELFSKTTWKKTEAGEYKCWRCDNCFDVEAIENEAHAHHEEAEEILSIPNLLNNLEFHEAEKKLAELEEKYPQNPKVYFYKVLAANCITYIKDESRTGEEKWIPTLNNISAEPLSSLSAYKRCLEVAQGEEKDHYKATFDFIESKRNEVLEDYSTGKYNYDVFISTKVSKLDFSNPAQPVPVLDANGDSVVTDDAKLASQIYDKLRHDNPRLRVFYSEREKEEMAGQRFENVIFSALHSAKVFILVANDINHVNWRWVKNEWKRYLYLMDPSEEGYKNRHIILVGKGLAKAELPFELKKREFVDFGHDPIAGPLTLIKFVETSLHSGDEYEKLVAQSFDSSVASLNSEAIELTQMQTTSLGATVKEVDVKVEEESRYWIKQTDDDEPSARKDAFAELRKFVERNPDAYNAKIHLLLEDTDFTDIDEYFCTCFNVYTYPKIAEGFFKMAKKEDAIARLESFSDVLCDAVTKYSWEDLFRLVKAADLTVAKNLGYLSKETLKKLFNTYDQRIESLPKDFNDLSFLRQYFDLHLFFTNKDPKKYVARREQLLFRFEDPKIIQWISDSILKVDQGNVSVLWSTISSSIFGKVTSLKDYIAFTHQKDIFTKEDLVGNQNLLDCFGKIFLYAPKDDKGQYLYAFLSTLLVQEKTYSFQGAEGEGDSSLSGYALFKKYIGFDLSGVTLKLPTPLPLEAYYKNISPDAYRLKKEDKIIPLDELLCQFAVKLHKRGQFALAIDLYQTYLAQQSSINYIDTLMIRYYQTLAEVGCINPEEVTTSSQKFDCVSIGVALANYDGKEYDAFRKFITHLERDRASYHSTYDSLKQVFTLRPKAVFPSLTSLKNCQKKFNEQFAALKERGTAERVITALKDDLSNESATLSEEISGLEKAKANLKRIRSTNSEEPFTSARNLYERDRFNANAKIDEYLKIYEQWGDAEQIEEAKQWCEQAKQALAGLFADSAREKKAKDLKTKKQLKKRGRANALGFTFFWSLPLLLLLTSLGLQVFKGFIPDLYYPFYSGRFFFWNISFGDDAVSLVYGHEGLLRIFKAYVDPKGIDSVIGSMGLMDIISFALTFGLIPIGSLLGRTNKTIAVFSFIAVAPLALFGAGLIIAGLLTLVALTLSCGFEFLCASCFTGNNASGAGPITWILIGLALIGVSALLILPTIIRIAKEDYY